MNSTDLLTGKQHRRHLQGVSSGRLKGNKVTVSNDVKSRPLKARKDGDTDITVESAEFQLLVRLYVPAKLLIKNNKVLKKQLFNYLPVIVNESLPELNFKLHIFLSTIVTTYISSWYLEKLNTDNFEFLESVYGILCDFVKDFARRVLRIVELDGLLDMVDEWAQILDTHVRLALLDKGVPRMVNEYLERNTGRVVAREDLMPENVLDQVLQESHVIFTQHKPSTASDMASVIHEPFSAEEVGSHSANEELRDPLLDYLRVTTRKILISTFQAEDTTLVGQGPTSSAIVMNLITIIVADLVLEKLVTKLSSPQFILQGLIGKVASDMQAKEPENEEKKVIPFHKKLTLLIQKAYFTLNSVALTFRKQESHEGHHRPVLFSPVFALIDAITGISERKPTAVYLAKVGRSIIFSSEVVSLKIDGVAKSYLGAKIRQSSVLKDTFLASVVQKLSDIVFSKSSEESNDPEENETLEEVTKNCFALLKSERFPVSPMWFAYKGETEEHMRNSVQSFLQTFDLDNKNPSSPFSASSKVNQLLVIRLFDSLVQYVYPELVVTVSAGER